MNLRRLRLQAAIFLVAVPLNLVWEVAQVRAYAFPREGLVADLAGCFVPSLGDGVLTLVVYWAGWLALGDPAWMLRPGLKGFILMVVLGFGLAVGIEWNALYRTGAWAYRPGMPRIPIVGAGLLPVLQMVLLPPLTGLVVRAWWRRREGQRWEPLANRREPS